MPHGSGNGLLTKDRLLNESTGVYRLRRRKDVAKQIAKWLTLVGALGGSGFVGNKITEARAEAAAQQRQDDRLEQHDKEIAGIHSELTEHGHRLEDMAVFLGVPRDYRNAPNLGVVPMPAASRPKPKPREPQ